MHTTTLLHSTQCCAMFCPKNVYKWLYKTKKKFHVLQTLIFLEKKLDLYHKPEKNPGDKLEINTGVQDLKFF